MPFEQAGLTLVARTRRDTDQEELDREAVDLFNLFQRREKEFGFNPNIIVEYPDVTAREKSALLSDPVGSIEERIAEHERASVPIARVVVLTTFADRMRAPLEAAGYRSARFDMPAGPEFTWWFDRTLPEGGEGKTLYLEAVDEADEKIRPGFVLQLRDGRKRLRGGACGSIHDRDGTRFCYLATMTLDVGLPPLTGMRLGEALLQFLRDEGVATVHLGTQTAGPFYEKLGFHVTHRVLGDLRFRQDAAGAALPTDLVMMERAI